MSSASAAAVSNLKSVTDVEALRSETGRPLRVAFCGGIVKVFAYAETSVFRWMDEFSSLSGYIPNSRHEQATSGGH